VRLFILEDFSFNNSLDELFTIFDEIYTFLTGSTSLLLPLEPIFDTISMEEFCLEAKFTAMSSAFPQI
jgi:hypothetical protein